jgi:hypothetical protein
MKSEVCKTKVDKGDGLLACILDAVARINKYEDQLRQTTRDFRTITAKCLEVYNGIFSNFL